MKKNVPAAKAAGKKIPRAPKTLTHEQQEAARRERQKAEYRAWFADLVEREINHFGNIDFLKDCATAMFLGDEHVTRGENAPEQYTTVRRQRAQLGEAIRYFAIGHSLFGGLTEVGETIDWVDAVYVARIAKLLAYVDDQLHGLMKTFIGMESINVAMAIEQQIGALNFKVRRAPG